MPEPANNPTEPTPTAAEPTPAGNPPVVEGEPQPAASEPTLLGKDAPADGEPKPADPKPDDPKEPPKPEGAPDKYEFTAPEGKEYDANLLGAFSEAAKEANLTQDAAQKLLDKMAPSISARQVEQVEAIHKQWRESSTSDKEFGGEKLQENLGIAKKAYDQFASPELQKLLESTSLGNHPEVIRLMYRIGKAISEDKFVTGRPSVTASPETVFFPTMVDK